MEYVIRRKLWGKRIAGLDSNLCVVYDSHSTINDGFKWNKLKNDEVLTEKSEANQAL